MLLLVPTHKPIARIDYPDLVFKNEKGKLNAIVEDIVETNKTGQPVLVGTVSIEKSEPLSSSFKEKRYKASSIKC